ncbi:MAG: RNA polymerase subunit sigma, partial [Planctomycetes bacterium]|nr:RNA polymerase subunit sigma [Planctomycetota bacterium]
GRQKHGRGLRRHDIQIAEPADLSLDIDVLAIDEALTELAAKHPDKAQLVKLRYFAGLTLDQAAAAIGVSSATADRHWKYARAWMVRELRRSFR